MSFVDKVTIQVKSGKGGEGACSFRREKYVPKGGPDGGDGGDGGSVILETNPTLQTLLDIKIKQNYKAKNGNPGMGNKKFGTKGPDLILQVPCGTLIFDENHSLIADLKSKTDSYIAAQGGKGGKGNPHFATATQRTPRYAQPGLPGEEKKLTLELRLIAEVGLVGFPNAGKSTLLKTLTRANPKIADYPFTTLTPNLGTLKFPDQEIIIADIPGLIEGASDGVGLGDEFLRHIDRTELLVYLIAVEEDPEETWANFKVLENELRKSPYKLLEKERIITLSKVDEVAPEILEETLALFKKNDCAGLALSSFGQIGIAELTDEIREARAYHG